MQENIYKRLAQAEAMAAAQKAETMEVLQAAYKRACEELNEEDAAAFARKIRDKLLNETDSRVTLDLFYRLAFVLKIARRNYYGSLGNISPGAPRPPRTRGLSV